MVFGARILKERPDLLDAIRSGFYTFEKSEVSYPRTLASTFPAEGGTVAYRKQRSA